jgi:hypothetical protein
MIRDGLQRSECGICSRRTAAAVDEILIVRRSDSEGLRSDTGGKFALEIGSGRPLMWQFARAKNWRKESSSTEFARELDSG